MRLLLDTHIYLWVLLDSPKLNKTAKKMIMDADEVYVSSVSIWEASIKLSLGKLDIDMSLLSMDISVFGYAELPVRFNHSLMVAKLPHIHKDPFDRLLVAQAMSEPLNFLTSDRLLAGYSELVLTV